MLVATVCVAFASGAVAQVDMGDVILEVQNGRIVTGAGYDAGVFQPARVFALVFGDIFPDSTNEPGFDSSPFTSPTPSSNGFRILDVLRRWNGQNFSEQAVPRLEVAALGLTAQTPASPGAVEGFALPVGSNGQWHRHLDFTLLSPATTGVYLLELSLLSTSPAVQESEPFWIVFGQNVDIGVFTGTFQWARNNLPGTPPCTDFDFNNDGLFPDTQDIGDLAAVFAGGACPTASCDSVDFNGDRLFPDTEDIADCLAVFAGGSC
jgi:hypothetical protein